MITNRWVYVESIVEPRLHDFLKRLGYGGDLPGCEEIQSPTLTRAPNWRMLAFMYGACAVRLDNKYSQLATEFINLAELEHLNPNGDNLMILR